MTPRIESFLTRLEQQQWLAVASIAVMMAAAVRVAASKALWFDELLTFHVAGLDRMSDIPRAILDGADVQPLLGYLLARGSATLAGDGELALRLPSLAGFGVTCWAIFRFTSPRTGPAAAAAAIIFFGLTEAYSLAYEARPYGLWLGFTALALLSWSEVAQGRRRRAALAGLGLSLAAALASHYYAVLVFVPIALAEAARTWRRGKPDWPVWGSMAAATLALAAHLPLVQATRTIYSTGFWSPAEPLDLAGSYIYLLAPAFWPALSILLLWAFTVRSENKTKTEARLLLEERVALGALAAIPFIAVPLALLVTKAYVYRYSAPALIALSILFGLCAERVAADRRAVITATALVLFGWFVTERVVQAPPMGDPTRTVASLEQLTAGEGLQVAIASPHLYFQYQHYGKDFSERLTYVADPEWALRELGTNSAGLNLTRMGNWAPIQVEQYSEFLRRHHDFLVCRRRGDRFEWLTARLEAEGKQLREIGVSGPLQVLRCCE